MELILSLHMMGLTTECVASIPLDRKQIRSNGATSVVLPRYHCSYAVWNKGRIEWLRRRRPMVQGSTQSLLVPGVDRHYEDEWLE